LYNDSVEGVSFNAVTRKMGFGYTNNDGEWVPALLDENGGLNQGKIPTVQQILNRLLVLEVADQNKVFDAFFERLERRIENAKADGTYDPGMQAYKAQSIVKKSDEVVYRHPGSTAETRIVEIEAADPVKFTKFEDLPKIGTTPIIGYFKNSQSGRVYAVKAGGMRTLESGEVTETYRRIGIQSAEMVPVRDFAGERYIQLSEEEAREAWNAEIAKADPMRRRTAHFVVGSF